MKLTPGKLAGMKAVSDKRGMIAAAAMDQRGSLQKALAKEKGSDVSSSMLEEFKSIVTEGFTACGRVILLAYEETGYDKPGFGRLAERSGGGLREGAFGL
jgi:tagatose 1,6-diphosphate aldolase